MIVGYHDECQFSLKKSDFNIAKGGITSPVETSFITKFDGGFYLNKLKGRVNLHC